MIFHCEEWIDFLVSHGEAEEFVFSRNGGSWEVKFFAKPVRSKLFKKVYVNPPLTPYAGFLFNKEIKDFQTVKKLIEQIELRNKIRNVSIQSFPTSIFSPLGFSLSGYKLSTYSTFVVQEVNESLLGKKVKKSIRNYKSLVEIKEITSRQFIDLLLDQYNEAELRYSLEFLLGVIDLGYKLGSISLRGAFKKKDNTLISCGLFLFDKSYCHYLVSGTTVEGKALCGLTHIVQEMIASSIEKGLKFNFEGSRDPNIAQFFKSMGGLELPIYHLRK